MAINKIIKVNSNKLTKDIDILELPIKEILSYSRLDCFKSCEYKYKLKYIDKNYTNDSSIALLIGTILHLGLEFKYLKKYSNDEIMDIVYKGFKDGKEEVMGINEIKSIYPFEWEEKDKNGRTYNEKMKLYTKRIYEDIDREWECIGCEVEFHINYENKAVIKGFIDRVDKNIKTNEIRVVDYKSSASEYQKKDLATPMQMFIYALACKELYGKYPTNFIYDMILIGSKQAAMTKGWENRGFKALTNRIGSLIYHQDMSNMSLKPKPTPLCYWCSYSNTNPNAEEGKDLCIFYSLWTPDNKTFKKNQAWIEPTLIKTEEDNGWGEGWD